MAAAALVEEDSRSWLGGDVAVITAQEFTRDQRQAVSTYEHVISLEAMSSASSPLTADPVAVAVRAIDPSRYTFYSALRCESGISVREALTGGAVLLSRDASERLRAGPGQTIRLGPASFRVGGILALEQDRLAASMDLYPRAILSTAAFQAAGLATSGIHIRRRIVFRVPGDTEAFLQQLDNVFPLATVMDYRRLDPRFVRLMHFLRTLLFVAGGSALGLGILASLAILFFQLERKLDDIATLKVLGANSKSIFLSYCLQVLSISLAACGGGLVMGRLLAPAVAAWASANWSLSLSLRWPHGFAAAFSSCAIAAALAVALIPISRLSRVRPLAVLRRRMAGGKAHSDLARPMLAFLTAAATFVALPAFLRGPGLQAGLSSIPYASADLIVAGLRQPQAIAMADQLRNTRQARSVEVHALARIRAGNQTAIASCRDDLDQNDVALSSRYAELLHVKAGSQLGISGKTFHVKQVVEMDAFASARFGIQLPCRHVQEHFPAFYEVAIIGDTASLLALLKRDYPAAAVLKVSEVRQALQVSLARAVALLQFVTSLTLVSAATVLAALTISAAQHQRRGIAIRKALGATRGRLLANASIRFAKISLIAGAAASLLAGGAATLICYYAVGLRFLVWNPEITSYVVGGTAIAGTLAGSFSTLPLLHTKPLQLLRDE